MLVESIRLYTREIGIRRRSRERRSPVSEIVTDTPTICQRDTGQRGRSAMDTPRHEGTPYLIEVTSRPGKYELCTEEFILNKKLSNESLWRVEKKTDSGFYRNIDLCGVVMPKEEPRRGDQKNIFPR